MEEFILTRKYDPKSVDDLILSADNRKSFSDFDLKQSPNLLFIGNPGVGKTTLAKLLSRDYDYLYVNASDESGIDTIRNKVTDFIKTASLLNTIKVVILDEADGLSSVGGGGTSAQQALRNMMEENLDNCRFILTANYEHKIMDALKSRTRTHYFSLNVKDCAKRIFEIARSEKIKITKENLAALIKAYAPDLRKCINEFQSSINSGVFVFVKRDCSEIASKVYKCITNGVDPFAIRASLIKDADSFESNYHSLMRGLFDLYCKDGNKESVKKICYHMEKDGIVVDKEVNFTSLLLSLSKT